MTARYGLPAVLLVALVFVPVAPAAAQEPADGHAIFLRSVTDGGDYTRSNIMESAARMPEESYAFRPTADVRSFGELLTHIAQSNSSRVRGREPSLRTRTHAKS